MKSELEGLEMWAGVECTVNRVGNRFFDQLERNGHDVRFGDLDRIANLGVTAVRYPIIWERTAPGDLASVDWSWSDERLNRLRELNLRPIVGLVHHGSGPRHTNLLDPRFPEKLADYSRAIAERYPWVRDYTPINEPLTTARFSCLYGHWYPHKKDPVSFARAMLNQCRAVVLSMRAIQEINPQARLIQTEDLGKTHSTPTLNYQAVFENERRWLTFDLLCGFVTPETEMWRYFRSIGITESELNWFRENNREPDVIGINHYITSERFLDERLQRYPTIHHGGNHQHRYADVEAVRVCAEGVAGPEQLLKEVWERYHLPLAITEAHLGCTREEQMRWLGEIWNAAARLRKNRVDIRAVTAWSAFGSFDWDSLLTRDTGNYESGIFDLRSAKPRPTALVAMVQSLAKQKQFDHPCLDTPGWWHRLHRLSYPFTTRTSNAVASSLNSSDSTGRASRALLITGATGTLGRAFARICAHRGLPYYLLTRAELDIADERSVAEALEKYEPWAIINTAGYVRVDDAETDVARCLRENLDGPINLARACAAAGLPLVSFSSDLVFDGTKREPYIEDDAPSPLNVYGHSKARAEAAVLEILPSALMIRTSAFFGPWDQYNFVNTTLQAIARGKKIHAAMDVIISPTYVPDLVNTTLDLLIDNESGIWHLSNEAEITWVGLGRLAAELGGYDPELIRPCDSRSLGWTARRPVYGALASDRGRLLPRLRLSMEKFLEDWEFASAPIEKVRRPQHFNAINMMAAVPSTNERGGSYGT